MKLNKLFKKTTILVLFFSSSLLVTSCDNDSSSSEGLTPVTVEVPSDLSSISVGGVFNITTNNSNRLKYEFEITSISIDGNKATGKGILRTNFSSLQQYPEIDFTYDTTFSFPDLILQDNRNSDQSALNILATLFSDGGAAKDSFDIVVAAGDTAGVAEYEALVSDVTGAVDEFSLGYDSSNDQIFIVRELSFYSHNRSTSISGNTINRDVPSNLTINGRSSYSDLIDEFTYTSP